MAAAAKPAVPLSKVPSVRELCELLGLQHASLKDTNIFMESTRSWRKSFQTCLGRPGATLLNWNNQLDQIDLEEMAQEYIDFENNGMQFWAPDRSWNHGTELQLPRDRDRIVALLKQLFWKQNRYAANNSQYGHKNAEARDSSKEATPTNERRSSTVATVVIDSALSKSTIFPSSKRPKSPPLFSKTSTFTPTNPKPLPASSKSTFASAPDIYEVPDDSDPDDDTTVNRSPKRARSSPKTKESPRKKKTSIPKKVRRTQRAPQPRSFPGIVPTEQIDCLIDEKSEDEDHIPQAHSFRDTRSGSPPLLTFSNGSMVQFPHFGRTPIEKRPSSMGSMVNGTAPTAPMYPAERSLEGTPQKGDDQKSNDAEFVSDAAKLPFEIRHNRQLAEQRKQHSRASDPGLRWNQSTVEDLGVDEVMPENLSEDYYDRGSPQFPEDVPDRTQTSASNAPTHNHRQASEVSTAIPDRMASLKAPTHNVIAGNVSTNPITGESEETILVDTRTNSPVVTIGNRESSNHPPTYNAPMPSIETKVKLSTPLDSTPSAPTPPPPNRQPKSQPQQAPTPVPTPTPAPEARSRPKTQIPLWIITRTPRYTEERWDTGKFSGTSLPDFLASISQLTQETTGRRQNQIEKIKLTLHTPDFDTKISVLRGAEESWKEARETFVEKLKEVRRVRGAGGGGISGCKILVEPFYEEGGEVGGVEEEEEEEFEF